MFSITSRDRKTGTMSVEEILGTNSLVAANISLKRFEDHWSTKEAFLSLGSRADESGNRYFPTTTDGDTYHFPS